MKPDGSVEVEGLESTRYDATPHVAESEKLGVSKSSSKFPSLENQKLADLAYKQLGLELEPITEADLNRVKALGYDGGVAVASGSAGLGGLEDRMIRPGDILVGLGSVAHDQHEIGGRSIDPPRNSRAQSSQVLCHS